MIDSDTHRDMTEEFEVYRKGKTVTCYCGQKIGIGLKRPSIKCPKCNVVIIDDDAQNREPPETEQAQTTLGDW